MANPATLEEQNAQAAQQLADQNTPAPAQTGQAPAAPQPQGQTWHEKQLEALKQGFTWEQIMTAQQAKYNEGRDAGFTHDQIMTAFGDTAPGAQQAVAAGLKAAYDASKEPKPNTLEQGAMAVASFWRPYQEDVARIAAEGVHGAQAGALQLLSAGSPQFHNEDFGLPTTGDDGLDQGVRAAAGLTGLGGGLVHMGLSPVLATLDPYSSLANKLAPGIFLTPTSLRDALEVPMQFLVGHATVPHTALRPVDEWYAVHNVDPAQFTDMLEANARNQDPSFKGLDPKQRALIQGRFPPQRDFNVGAVQVGGSIASPSQLATITQGLKQHWVETGEPPIQAADRAAKDPIFRHALLTGELAKEPLPAGSVRLRATSTASTQVLYPDHGDLAVPKQEDGGPAKPEPEVEPIEPRPANKITSNHATIRAMGADWIGSRIDNQVRITGQSPGVLTFKPRGAMTPEQAGLSLAAKLREEGTQFDTVNISEQGVTVSVSRRGPNRGLIEYNGVAPTAAANGAEFVPETAIPALPKGPAGARTFEDAIPWLMREEGSATTTDTGGLTKFGISQHAYPTEDIAGMTAERAKFFYKRDYWDAIQADKLPPEMRLAAFDSAVNEGVGATKEWLRQAGGDLNEFMRLREERYAELAKDPRYAKYAEAWQKRLNDLGVAATSEPEAANENVAELSPEERQAVEGEAPEEPALPSYDEQDADDVIEGKGIRSFLSEEAGSGPGILGLELGDKETTSVSDEIAGKMGVKNPSNFWQNFKRPFQLAWRALYEKDGPINQIIGLARGQGIPDPIAQLPLFLRRIAEYAPDKGLYSFHKSQIDLDGNIVGPSYMSIVKPFMDERGSDNFFTYELSRQAIDYAKRKISHPVTLDQATQHLAELNEKDPARAAKYRAAHDQLVNFRNNSIKLLSDPRVGLLTPAKAAKLIRDLKDYIPGRRLTEASSKGKAGVPQRAFGSQLTIRDIMLQDLQNTINRHVTAATVRANNEAVKLAQQVGVIVRSKDAPVELDAVPNEAGDLEKIDDGKEAALRAAQMMGVKLDPSKVTRFENGKAISYEVDTRVDPQYQVMGKDFVHLIQRLDSHTLRAVTKLLQPAANLLRAAVTLPPAFALRVLTLDPVFQAFTNPEAGSLLKGMADGVVNVFGNTAKYDEAQRFGMLSLALDRVATERYITTRAGLTDKAFTGGIANWPGNIIQGLRNVRAAGQHILATGAYVKAARAAEAAGEPIDLPKLGYDTSEAVFHRMAGGGPLGKDINMAWPFFIADLRKLDTAWRSLARIPRKETKIASFKQVYGVGAVMTGLTLMHWAANKDQNWYKAQPEWKKDFSLSWHVGPDWEATGRTDENGNPEYVKHGFTIPIIPIVPGFGTVFSALPRRIAEAMVDHDPTAADGIVQSLQQEATVSGGPALLTPIMEGAFNHSEVTGRQIVPDSLKADDPSEQYEPYTSNVARLLGALTRPLPKHAQISPILVDYDIRAMAGNPGVAIVDTLSSVLSKAGIGEPSPEPASVEKDLLHTALGTWYSQSPDASSQPLDTSYDVTAKETSIYHAMMHAYKEGDLPRFQQLMKDHPAEVALHNFDLGSSQPPANDDQFQNEIEGASEKIDGSQGGALDRYLTAKDALKNAKTAIRQIEALPLKEDAAPVDTQNMLEAAAITPNDKRQLLDTLGATTMHAAMQYNKSAAELGIK